MTEKLTVALFCALSFSCFPRDEGYPLCDLDPESTNEEVARCAADDEADRSCVARDQVQCTGMICGRYRGSEAFCTQDCSFDEDCEPAAQCRAWEDLGKFCTPSEL